MATPTPITMVATAAIPMIHRTEDGLLSAGQVDETSSAAVGAPAIGTSTSAGEFPASASPWFSLAPKGSSPSTAPPRSSPILDRAGLNDSRLGA